MRHLLILVLCTVLAAIALVAATGPASWNWHGGRAKTGNVSWSWDVPPFRDDHGHGDLEQQ